MYYRYKRIKDLILILKFAKSNPDHITTIFWDRSMTGREYVRWFRDCLNEKINRNIPEKGRKYHYQYQADQLIDARIIREVIGLRIRRSGTNILRTKELRERYPDINNPNSND